MEAVVVVVDDVPFVVPGLTRQPWVHLADYPAVVLEMGPAPPVDFPHPLDPCTRHSINPPECYIRKDSRKIALNLGWIIFNRELRFHSIFVKSTTIQLFKVFEAAPNSNKICFTFGKKI